MTERKARLDPLAVVCLVVCCILWGLNQAAAKTALSEMPALWQASIRSLGGAALVFMWSLARGIPLFGRDGTLVPGLGVGLLFAAEFACIFLGLQDTTASRMAVFLYLAPFVVALGMPRIARSERLARPQMAGLVVAFAGVAWAFAEGFTQPAAGLRQWLGDALGAAAAVLWGATTLAIRGSRLTAASPEKTLLYQLVVAGIVLAAAAMARGEVLPATLSIPVWASLFFQIIAVSFFSFLLWFWLVRHYPATQLSSFTLLTPVFGLLFGVLLLHEPITLRLAVALAAVSTGIYLVNRRGGQRSQSA